MRPAQRHLAAVLALGALLVPAASAPAADAPPAGQMAKNFDSRGDDRSAARATRRARGELRDALGAQGVVSTDRTTAAARVVARRDGFLTAAAAGDPADIALGYVRARPGVFGLDANDLAALRLTSRYRSPDGVTHLAWVQTANAIAAYDNVLFANVARDGRLVDAGGSAVADLAPASAQPVVSAAHAVGAARADVRGPITAPRATQRPGAERATSFANGDRARLTIFSDGRTDRLAWRTEVDGAGGIRYELVVDATDETLLLRRSLTEFASQASVHEDYPGAPGGGATTTVDLAADPSWLDRSQGATRLAGNNAHAYADTGGADGVDPGEDIPASGATDWLYPRTLFSVSGQTCPLLGGQPACSWDPYSGASMTTNRNQATTQLFYLVNRFHDHLAQAPIGFTHAARNFEFTDADGSGPGLGNDPVLAESNDSSGSDNANMSTPADGSSPRMQMYFWSDPATNSSDAADVVFHEYTHGLTNRSVGTGAGLSASQSGAMGEGWSDWYALDYLAGHGYRTDTAAPGEMMMSAYLAPPRGIREQPMDCPVGATAPACPGTPGAGPGGFTLGDMGKVIGYFQVHADGEIWSETLWDLRRALGATAAEALVTGGLRLAPDNPSFLEMRDAIIQADQVLGGTRYDALWSLFAARGMGYSAFTAGADAESATEAFDTPPVLSQQGATITDPAPGGDGDGVAEPGETLRIVDELRDPWGDPVTGVSATLSASTAGVTVPQPSATWPDFAAGATHAGTPPFAVAIPSGQPCGAPVSLKLTYATDQGGGTIPLTIATGLPASGAPSADVPKDIASSTGFTSELTFAAAGVVQNLELRIAKLTHTWVGDLYMTLESPAGTKVVLMNSPGGDSSGDDMTDLVLADDAPSAIAALPHSAPAGGYTGRYRPDQPLSAFNGESRQGTWKLHVHDLYPGADDGVLYAWGLAPIGGTTCDTGGNGRPLAVDDARSTGYDQPLQATSVLANDSDPDGDPLTAVKETEPGHGSVALAADGTFAYTPSPGFEGVDTFAYRAADATSSSPIATVRITVAPRPNTAPAARDDGYSLPHDTTLYAPSVLANDDDAENDPLTASQRSQPDHGYVEMASDGTFTYEPDGGFSGTDSFTYRAGDGRTVSADATVTLTVRPPNRAPYAVDDHYVVSSRGMLDIPDVLANDLDQDGDSLAATIERRPLNGELLQLAGDGHFLYRSDAGFIGTDVFSYTAVDPSGARSAPAFVTIVVDSPSSAPAMPYAPYVPAPPAAPGMPIIGQGHAASGLQLRRAALSGGRLDVLAEINASAMGSATVSFVARGVTTRMHVPIVDGQIRVRHRLSKRQRGATSGIVKVAYGGSDRVVGDAVALWAGPRRSSLRLTEARVDNRRLIAAGTLARGARGTVRLRVTYRSEVGAIATQDYALRAHPTWSLQVALPARVAAVGGRLLVQFDGDSAHRFRGEQVVRQLAPG
jgi:subtilisin-like proprotein convertase family protein